MKEGSENPILMSKTCNIHGFPGVAVNCKFLDIHMIFSLPPPPDAGMYSLLLVSRRTYLGRAKATCDRQIDRQMTDKSDFYVASLAPAKASASIYSNFKQDMCLWNTDAPGSKKVKLCQKYLSPTFWPRPPPWACDVSKVWATLRTTYSRPFRPMT